MLSLTDDQLATVFNPAATADAGRPLALPRGRGNGACCDPRAWRRFSRAHLSRNPAALFHAAARHRTRTAADAEATPRCRWCIALKPVNAKRGLCGSSRPCSRVFRCELRRPRCFSQPYFDLAHPAPKVQARIAMPIDIAMDIRKVDGDLHGSCSLLHTATLLQGSSSPVPVSDSAANASSSCKRSHNTRELIRTGCGIRPSPTNSSNSDGETPT